MRSHEALGFSGSVSPSLPQRLRLLCAARRVERVGGDAGAVLGPGVIPSKNLVVHGERGFAEGERFGWLAGDQQHDFGAVRLTERHSRGCLPLAC
jgi:hypothetical protein